jgi:cytochrome bd-type quinol oxidase subunit 2
MDFFSANIDNSLLTIHYLTAKAAKETQEDAKMLSHYCLLLFACCFLLLLPAAPLITDYSSLTLFAYCLLLPAFPLITDY